MTSKEALKRLYYDAISSIIDEEIECLNREEIEKDYMCVKQDLDRLEQLEDNIKIHKETIKMQHNQIEELEKQNKKLKDELIMIYNSLCY